MAYTVDVVTTGGTGTAAFCAAHDIVTEVQPRLVLFMDADALDTGGVELPPALMSIATVISRPAAGSRRGSTRAQDAVEHSGDARPVERRLEYHDAGDEHGIRLPIGDGRGCDLPWATA